MKRLMMIVALTALVGGCVFAFCGCQTRITAEKYPEQLASLDGTNKVVISGGWYVTARSPLWAKEQIRGLDVGAKKDGEVWLRTDSYDRDLSTNAIVMTSTIFDGTANLVAKVAAAYATVAGGAQTDSVASLAAKAVSLFTSKGGDADSATVTASDGTVTVTDGTATVTCKDGECSYVESSATTAQ